MNKIQKIFNLLNLNKIKLIRKINSLELKHNTLEETIKNELYKTFMEKLQEPQEINRLKRENKNLRLKNKTLKSLLREEKQ